jgi:serine/threonine-protein kinase HipA
MIADSLPDQWGNSLFRAWLAEQRISVKNVTPVDHLAFIGSRAMGALEFEPAIPLGDDTAFSVDVRKLYDFSRQVINDRSSITLSQENSILWQDLVKISSSPGGKRPKAIVALNHATGEVISGQGRIPEGFRNYILKYDDGQGFPYARLEYVWYRMAIAAGIQMMPSELRTYGNVFHFLTERFDRKENNKIHTQTLAAMSPYSEAYEDIFAVLRRLRMPWEDHRQQFLRMVFNLLSGNVDDHSKNVSFCMDRQGVWRLSPAYDMTFSVDHTAPAYVNRHSMSIRGKSEGITLDDLEEVGAENDIQDVRSLIQQVTDAVSRFGEFAREAEVPEGYAEAIGRFHLGI